MVFVQLGGIQTAAWSENTGVFSGQNIQNSWDSHSTTATSFGGSMGDYCLGTCLISLMQNYAVAGQPIYDQDVKGNAVHSSIA